MVAGSKLLLCSALSIQTGRLTVDRNIRLRLRLIQQSSLVGESGESSFFIGLSPAGNDSSFVIDHSRREDASSLVRNGASLRQSLIVSSYN
jgi:hypothetical protein